MGLPDVQEVSILSSLQANFDPGCIMSKNKESNLAGISGIGALPLFSMSRMLLLVEGWNPRRIYSLRKRKEFLSFPADTEGVLKYKDLNRCNFSGNVSGYILIVSYGFLLSKLPQKSQKTISSTYSESRACLPLLSISNHPDSYVLNSRNCSTGKRAAILLAVVILKDSVISLQCLCRKPWCFQKCVCNQNPSNWRCSM